MSDSNDFPGGAPYRRPPYSFPTDQVPPEYSEYDNRQYYRQGGYTWSYGRSSVRPVRRELNWKRPLLFYLLTWLSTTMVGQMYTGGGFWSGLWFSVPLMTILTCHEFGHYFQSRRYGVYSTLPYFIPVPFPPFGTFGAFIQMDARIPNPKALFDIGITGPLAGLVPTLIFMVIGIALSSVEAVSASAGGMTFGEPLLFRWVSTLFFDRSIPGTDLLLHPIGMAAWTGLFITSLNLIPIGQLDGGHVFYALLKRRAPAAARAIFALIVTAVILFEQWQWILMILLIVLIGVVHPPTADDSVPLGRFRTILGVLTLAFVIIGLTPNPIEQTPPPEPESPFSPELPNVKPNYSFERFIPEETDTPVFAFEGRGRSKNEGEIEG